MNTDAMRERSEKARRGILAELTLLRKLADNAIEAYAATVAPGMDPPAMVDGNNPVDHYLEVFAVAVQQSGELTGFLRDGLEHAIQKMPSHAARVQGIMYATSQATVRAVHETHHEAGCTCRV